MSIVSEVEDDVPDALNLNEIRLKGTTIVDNDDGASQTKHELAAQVCYDISRYPYLRSLDDFTNGIFLNKDKVKTQFLVFQSTVLHRSLLVLDSSEKDRLAIQIHKNVLGYMGDLSIPCPEMLAHDILRKGIEHKYIRDEIYTQIIKQLSNNPKSNSIAKGWQLMCMCVGTFPPSYDFENYLFHFIIEKRDKATGAVVNYARYCLRTLEAILSNGNGTDVVVPSIEEIQAYKSRPPILATIYLVDNNVVTEDFPIKPYLDVSKIIEMCAGWLGLKDVRTSLLGIFVYDLGDNGRKETTNLYDDLPRTPRSLKNDDFMGDVIVQKANQNRKFKFVLKKKIFLPRFNYRGDDSVYERLVYLQAKDDALVQGNIVVVDEESAAKLARLSMAVAYGKAIGSTINELVEAGLIDFIALSWRDKTLEYWANTILENRDTLVAAETSDLQDQFLQIVYKSQSYGTHWFYAHYREAGVGPEPFSGLPYDLQLGLNYEGVHVYTFDYTCLVSFPYSDIVEWSGSSDEFTIMITLPHDETYEFTLITAQASDIAAIIIDYITAIMEDLKEDNDIKEVKDDELQYYAYYS